MYHSHSDRHKYLTSMLALLVYFLYSLAPTWVAGHSLQVRQTEATIVVSENDKPMLVYNMQSPPVPRGINSIFQRSGFLHPVYSPQGKILTESFPADHPHQHGIFTAWVKTSLDGRPVNFWDLAGGTGRVLHDRVVSAFATSDSAGFEVDLIHRASGSTLIDVLRERWKITVNATDGDFHCFDLDTTQQALLDKPLVIHEHHYGGMAVRGPTRWLSSADAHARSNAGLEREPSSLLNDRRSDRFAGNHERARWVALTGTIEGRPVTIAVLCHRDNFRAPQSARIHPTKPYFCFAPCVEGEFQIDRDHPYEARFRCLVTDERPDANWLDHQWQKWCGE